MIPVGGKLTKELESCLRAEIVLYQRYIEALQVERSAYRKFNAEEISELTRSRALLVAQLSAANEKRMALMEQFPENTKSRLTELVKQFCHPHDQKILLPLLEDLRNYVALSRKEGLEMSSLSQFAQKVVNGTLSVIWSATQNVVSSYTRKGKKQVKYNPSNDRKRSVLKEA